MTVSGATTRWAVGLRSDWLVPTGSGPAPTYRRDFGVDGQAGVLAGLPGTGALHVYAGNGASGWKSTSVTGAVMGAGFQNCVKALTAGPWVATDQGR